MPRGKYVNHKGRSRNFTSPEELAHQNEESDETDTSSEEDEGASASTKSKSNTKTRSTKDNSSDNDSEESSEEDDRDARKGVASLIEIENPNRTVKKSAQKLKSLSLDEDAGKPELTRREREQIEKQKARLRYEKMHAAGKTNEAKADLARLALVRQQRAEAAAKREAEKKAQEEKKAANTKS